jgi:hypothetical protein
MAVSTTPALQTPADAATVNGIFPTFKWLCDVPVDSCTLTVKKVVGGVESAFLSVEVPGGGAQVLYWYKIATPLLPNLVAGGTHYHWTVQAKESGKTISAEATARNLYTPAGQVTLALEKSSVVDATIDGQNRHKKSIVYVKRDENYSDVTDTPDLTIPTILSTVPVHEAVNVVITDDIVINFSESMGPSTVTVSSAPTVVDGYTVTWNTACNSITLAHTTSFELDTEYTITVNGADIAGNEMVEDTFTFTTESGT